MSHQSLATLMQCQGTSTLHDDGHVLWREEAGFSSVNKEPITELLQGQANIAAAWGCIAFPPPRLVVPNHSRQSPFTYTKRTLLHLRSCSFVKTPLLVIGLHVKGPTKLGTQRAPAIHPDSSWQTATGSACTPHERRHTGVPRCMGVSEQEYAAGERFLQGGKEPADEGGPSKMAGGPWCMRGTPNRLGMTNRMTNIV